MSCNYYTCTLCHVCVHTYMYTYTCTQLSIHLQLFAVILSWFVDKQVISDALKGQLIEEDRVECRPEQIPDSVMDENVDVCLVRRYFSSDSWMLLDTVLKTKAKMMWACKVCHHDLHSEESIIREACLQWYHFRCIGLKTQPKARNWFCRSCFANAK